MDNLQLDIHNSLNHLKKEYGKSAKDLTDAEVLTRKENISKLNIDIDNLLTEMSVESPDRVKITGKVVQEYGKVTEMRTKFEEAVSKEIISRDFTADKREAMSDIIIARFGSTDDSLDFFNFRTRFERSMQMFESRMFLRS